MKIPIIILFISLIIASLYMFMNKNDFNQDNSEGVTKSFTSITPDELEVMLKDKDFVLIDVHTPEQKHIPGTDKLIASNEVDEIEKILANKNDKVVLYCRSGGMSKITAQELVDRGYTNVFEMKGGMNRWLEEGKEALPVGSIIN